MNPGGFCIGWRVEPFPHLGRGPIVPTTEFILPEGESLELPGLQQITPNYAIGMIAMC
jgi:hypothetical protein